MILGGPGSETYPIGWAPLANICNLKESYKQMFPTFWFSVEKIQILKKCTNGPPMGPYDTFNLWGPIICNNYMYIYIYICLRWPLWGPVGSLAQGNPTGPYGTLYAPMGVFRNSVFEENPCGCGGLPKAHFSWGGVHFF